MLPYVGNAPHCYADFAAMLLGSAGESVEPRLVEVLSEVGLGALWGCLAGGPDAPAPRRRTVSGAHQEWRLNC